MKKPDIEVIRAKTRVNQLMVHERHKFDPRAGLAMDLLKLSVSAPFEGENKRMTCEALVNNAVVMSDLLFTNMEERGWIIELPPLSVILDEDQRSVGFSPKE